MTNVQEIWKDIPDYEGYYQVSNLGNIKSLDRLVPSKKKNVGSCLRKGAIMAPVNNNGYSKISLRKNGKIYSTSIHRLVAIQFIENIENLPQVNHIDGNKKNNHFQNLEWVSGLDNIKHSVDTGLRNYSTMRKAKGEDAGNSKYSKEQILEIRSLSESGMRNIDIARKLSISRKTIGGIVRRDNWKHI